MKPTALRVTLVEDNSGDARLLREMLSTERPDAFTLTNLRTLREAEVQLAKDLSDIILLDLGLPDGHGLNSLGRVRAVAPEVPIIVLTGLDDEAIAAEAMREGAQDYLVKGHVEDRALPRVLRHAIERRRMELEAEALRNQQLRIKDELLSHVSHELRSPLASIYSFCTIISDGLAGATNPQQQEYLEIILRNTGQLQSMIEVLLAATELSEGKLHVNPRCVSVPEAVTYALDTLRGAAESKKIAVSFDPHPPSTGIRRSNEASADPDHPAR